MKKLIKNCLLLPLLLICTVNSSSYSMIKRQGQITKKIYFLTIKKAFLTKKINNFFILLEEYRELVNANAPQTELSELYARLKEQLKTIQKSPSLNHIAENLDTIIYYHQQYKLADQTIQKTIVAGLIKENELVSQGYVPFVHGRRRNYDFLTQLYTFLNALIMNKQTSQNFIPTHIKRPATDITEEKNRRKQLITEGNPFDSKIDPEGKKRRQTLLFLNHFLFGNINRPTSNSFLYMLENNNAGNVTIKKEQIFRMFKLSVFYKKYADQLDALEKEYNEISSYGQLIQIGITPKKLKKCVYLTCYGGPKLSLPIAEDTCSDQIDTIISHLDSNPQDNTTFAIINTYDEYGGLNEHGMKISLLDPADYDPVSYEKKIACNKKRDELFAAIEDDYNAAQKQRTA